MNTSTASSNLRRELRQIISDQPDSLKAAVAQEALDQDTSDIPSFFSDLLRHGCVSGWISSLIYYSDTYAFYDKHYSEIEDLRLEYEGNMGEPIRINSDLKNFMAWFAFEETAYQLANELELEI